VRYEWSSTFPVSHSEQNQQQSVVHAQTNLHILLVTIKCKGLHDSVPFLSTWFSCLGFNLVLNWQDSLDDLLIHLLFTVHCSMHFFLGPFFCKY